MVIVLRRVDSWHRVSVLGEVVIFLLVGLSLFRETLGCYLGNLGLYTGNVVVPLCDSIFVSRVE